MAIIELRDISFRYGTGTPFEKQALQDICLSVEHGAFIGIIGHTGSGKSTLIRHFNGLLRPDSGQVLVNNEDIWKHPKQIRSIRFQIGLVFQYPETQIFADTVARDIAYGPKNMGLDQETINQRVREALSFVGLDDSYLDRNPFRLSGGEMRRVAIAGVMAMRPAILVLDEPTAGLDPEGCRNLFDHLEQYRRKTNTAIVMVSHSMEEIAEHVQRVLVLDKGRIVLEGSVPSVFAHAGILNQFGLDVPQITKALLGLKKKGYPVDTSAVTVDQAENELLRLFEGKDDE
ncbi:energy-coupling factor transporter ATPase [Sporolactobacillus shoreicorticis]|uniref:Energy-coupling factor transporter ATP-binding protein EcfA2 n=1 Tax=Sporolactobacillus shoreicorticis TaxID=1923877 RepID=A0ABW5RZ57_9BACL|nr:energy-coupling factor transporter ATPase [Sporolactobacillus shoreicorticis]MCO7125205.1 energy-coupling factor transporter ATPase [Sporolactobacillus shoreicorticis]